MPVVEALAKEGIAVSIDTMKPEVMRRAIDAGCAVVNDVYGFRAEGAMEAVARAGVGVVAMHMQGTPGTMQKEPRYDDVVAEVTQFLLERAHALEAAGVARARIVLDPGFGFGKTVEHNKQLFRALPRIASHGYPVLAGVSRKKMIGDFTGRPAGRARRRQRCRCPHGGSEWRIDRARPRREGNRGCDQRLDGTQMSRKYFGTDGIRGRVGQSRSRRTS
jgi:dihydropteroate synthase